MNNNQLCPCQSRKKYQYCCGLYLSGKELPETAVQLMRSRYTAFATGDVDYILATRHPDRRQENKRQQIANNLKNTNWLGLNIISTSQGKKNDAIGYVEFVAIFKQNEIKQIHERSKFVKVDGKWFYLEGKILPNLIPKRNDNCWCGSGKKYRKCHGN